MDDTDQQGSILARFMEGDLDPAAAARELSALPVINWNHYLYWSEDLYQSGEVERRMRQLMDELKKFGIEPPAA